MNELTQADLMQVGDDGLRMLNVQVAERLRFAKSYNIRNLIKRNAAELAEYGGILRREENPKPGGGRPSDGGYLLTEGQVCLSR